MKLDSVRSWDLESQRRFWNQWDASHLRDSTLGSEALERGAIALAFLLKCRLDRPEIIEFGCGNGWLAEKLVGIGSVTGVDIADEAIAEARRRVPSGTFFAGDALSIELPAERFDVAISLEMFSHVSDQSAFVEGIARVLKKGGYLILITQNRTVYLRRKNIGPPADGQLRHWVTMRSLQAQLRSHFGILEATTFHPSGERGFLRVVNSAKLNRLASKVVSMSALRQIKEQCGLGQTLLVLAQKRD